MIKPESKLFIPNVDNLLFTVTIQVFENCAKIGVTTEKEMPTYHQVVGVLETQKHHLMSEQRDINIKASKIKNKAVQKVK